MQQVTTFDIAFDDGIVIDGKMQGVSGRLRGQVLGIWNRLQRAASASVDRTPASKAQAVSGYYAGAYDRASASMPVVSLRSIARSDAS